MTALCLREVHLIEQATRLGRVVVRNSGLEVLAKRRRLTQLSAEPAEQTDGRLALHFKPQATSMIDHLFAPRREPC